MPRMTIEQYKTKQLLVERWYAEGRISGDERDMWENELFNDLNNDSKFKERKAGK